MGRLSEEQKLIQNKRRNIVLSLKIHGMTQEEISNEMKVSRQTIVRDIKSKRKELMKDFKSIDNVIADLLAAKNVIIKDLYDNYAKTESIKDKTYILNSIWNISHDFAKVLRPDIIYQQNNLIKQDNVIVVKWDNGSEDKISTARIPETLP